MSHSDLPKFPAFKWDEYVWATSVKLPAWTNYKVHNEPYGRLSANGRSNGIVQIRFASEGRSEEPLSTDEMRLVKWVIDHKSVIHDAMLGRLFEEYLSMREQAKD